MFLHIVSPFRLWLSFCDSVIVSRYLPTFFHIPTVCVSILCTVCPTFFIIYGESKIGVVKIG